MSHCVLSVDVAGHCRPRTRVSIVFVLAPSRCESKTELDSGDCGKIEASRLGFLDKQRFEYVGTSEMVRCPAKLLPQGPPRASGFDLAPELASFQTDFRSHVGLDQSNHARACFPRLDHNDIGSQ